MTIDRDRLRHQFREWDKAAVSRRILDGDRCMWPGCEFPATYVLDYCNSAVPDEVLERRVYCREHVEDGLITLKEQVWAASERRPA